MCNSVADFKDCVFEGPPPEGFISWSEWASAGIKTGVTIKATVRTAFNREILTDERIRYV